MAELWYASNNIDFVFQRPEYWRWPWRDTRDRSTTWTGTWTDSSFPRPAIAPSGSGLRPPEAKLRWPSCNIRLTSTRRGFTPTLRKLLQRYFYSFNCYCYFCYFCYCNFCFFIIIVTLSNCYLCFVIVTRKLTSHLESFSSFSPM